MPSTVARTEWTAYAESSLSGLRVKTFTAMVGTTSAVVARTARPWCTANLVVSRQDHEFGGKYTNSRSNNAAGSVIAISLDSRAQPELGSERTWSTANLVLPRQDHEFGGKYTNSRSNNAAGSVIAISLESRAQPVRTSITDRKSTRLNSSHLGTSYAV